MNEDCHNGHFQMGRTLNMVQRAFNFGEDGSTTLQPPRPPLSDTEFRKYLDPVGQIIYSKELRSVIYFGGIDPSLRYVPQCSRTIIIFYATTTDTFGS